MTSPSREKKWRPSSPPISAIIIAISFFFVACVYLIWKQEDPILVQHHHNHRRLSIQHETHPPPYMSELMQDLNAREQLFETTPPEEVKYWFEYTGPLQKYFYRYSKSRMKADYFEGRDDSGVTSSRFVSELGGGSAFRSFHSSSHSPLLDYCLQMGHESRPNRSPGSVWYQFFHKQGGDSDLPDRCRVLVVLNTVGAGRSSTILWETQPPSLVAHGAGPLPWMSEQETAATHLQRNLEEINAMCETGILAVRLQILVCEPIPALWVDWMDALLPNCGGSPAPFTQLYNQRHKTQDGDSDQETERPSPVQVVVVANTASASTCHDLKSGFMEQRMQDLIVAPPYLNNTTLGNTMKRLKGSSMLAPDLTDASIKGTHTELVSSEPHDLYIALKWSSLLTLRAVSAFIQASADIVAAAASPKNHDPNTDAVERMQDSFSTSSVPPSPFLIPSFVRVSYVSEENNKVAKWRMHGDFFHPAAWEICKESFEMLWLPHSLAGTVSNKGSSTLTDPIRGLCYLPDSIHSHANGYDCGQWWILMTEEQMPTPPEVYGNEHVQPLIQGGSNFFWMITERQRQEIVKQKICERETQDAEEMDRLCGPVPQGIIPLGDMESFLINFTPNTALGKKHLAERRPGYTHADQQKRDREIVRERKLLHGHDEIEKALFDYTIYPAALFRKDATLKAVRARDAILSKDAKWTAARVHVDTVAVGPQIVKSSYYDVTITKPRQPVPGWCQAIARKGLCALYATYFRESDDARCVEACGMKKNWSHLS